MKKSDNNYIVLHSNCVLVKGAKHCIIQDNQRQRIVRIPEIVHRFLMKYNRTKIASALEEFDEKILNEIVDYLHYEEFIFFTDDLTQFPVLDETYHCTEIINNCIIEYNSSHFNYYESIANDLKILGCKHLELRIDGELTIGDLNLLLEHFSKTRLLTIDLVVRYINQLDISQLYNLYSRFGIIDSFNLHSVPIDVIETGKGYDAKFQITDRQIDHVYCCGTINTSFFSINSQAYRLSRKFNNCLHRKISISMDGSIKICPSMQERLGNIETDSFYSVCLSSIHHTYNTITKDDIEICKVCEYRYACSDCRAFLTVPNNKYSKPLKCGYDPYTGEWEEWSTNPLKQKAIEYYGMQELVKKND